jgi:hypothetical protein
LTKYLADNFSQNLLARQSELTSALAEYANTRITILLGNQSEKIGHFLLLNHLKVLMRDLFELRDHEALQPANLQLFGLVAKKMKARVSELGGQLLFVYLPSPARFSAGRRPAVLSARDRVLAMVRELGIAVVDLEAVFRKSGDPLSFYAFGVGHLNKAGYSAAGLAVLDHIAAHNLLH